MGGCQGNMCMPNMGNMGMPNMGGMGGCPGGMGGMPMNGMEAMVAAGPTGQSSFEVLQSALRMIPPQVSEDPRGFSLRCAVPNRLVEGLLGKGGSIANEVRNMTGARIEIPNNPSDPDNRAMSITGPLYSTVAAYIYMMKQYLEIEACSAQQRNGMGSGMGPANIPGMNPMGSNMLPAEMRPLCAEALGQMEQQLTIQLVQVKQMREQLAAI